MKIHRSLFWLTLLFLVFVTGGREKTFAQEKSQTSSEQKTAALIDEILLETPMLASKENRITIYTLIADLLWSRDEKRARRIAAETADLLRTELAPNDDSNSMLQFPPLRYADLRHDFLVILSRRDIAFAREMKIYTLPVMPKFPATTQSEKNQLRNWNNDERDLEQKMAFQTAAKNISAAQNTASKSLALGVTNESLNVLRRFHLRDAATADAFAAELIEKLTAADFAKDKEAQETAAMFLFQIDENKGAFGMPRSCNCPAKPLNLDPQKIRRMASKWLDFAAASTEVNIFNDFLTAMPVLQKLLPERNAAIQTKLAAIKKAEPKKFERAQLKEQIFDDKTAPETIASMALKEGNDKFNLYREAFVKAANNSKTALEKLLAAVSEHPDGDEKNWVVDQINANLAGKTAEDGDLEKALEMAQKVIARDRRIGLLSFLALEFLEKGDREKAKQVSDEIALLMDLKTKDKLPKAIVGYNVLPGLVGTFALTDPERALMLLERVLPESTDFFPPGFSDLNGDGRVDLQSFLKRGSYILDSKQKSLKSLIDFDYDRTKNLSKYFSKPEFSVVAKLILAQTLAGEKIGFGFGADREEMIILKN